MVERAERLLVSRKWLPVLVLEGASVTGMRLSLGRVLSAVLVKPAGSVSMMT